jgi:uncharacterized tellurite resistance protein B-like protein
VSTIESPGSASQGASRSAAASALRRITQQLRQADAATARYLASFASVLARVAHADLRIDSSETAEMRRRVAALAEISPEEAACVVECATEESRTLDGGDKREVTREFVRISTPKQRTELIFCLYAVAGADGKLVDSEIAEIDAIAAELGVARREVSGLHD